jgi:hypothetical protein
MYLKSIIFYNMQGLFPLILYIDDILIQNMMSKVYSDVKSQDWTVNDHRLSIVLLTRFQNPVYPHNLLQSCYSPINNWRNFQINIHAPNFKICPIDTASLRSIVFPENISNVNFFFSHSEQFSSWQNIWKYIQSR